MRKGPAQRKSSEENKSSEPDAPIKPSIRAPLFEYPPLPLWETRLNFTVVAIAFSLAWYMVWKASQNFQWTRGWGSSRVETWPILGTVRRDVTNYEWEHWHRIAQRFSRALIAHTFVFNGLHHFLKHRHFLREALYLAFSICICTWVFVPKILAFSLLHGLVIFGASKLASFLKERNKFAADWIPLRLIIWGFTAPLLYYSFEYVYYLSSRDQIFPAILFASYKLLQYVGFALEMYSGKTVSLTEKSWRDQLWEMYCFAFYLPYVGSVIVLYPDFKRQINERETKPRAWKATLWHGVRVFFWYWFIELVLLNFFYFEAILGDIRSLYAVDEGTLVSLGYAIGQFFHMKYVVIFGLGAFFAKLDNMDPPEGPICITRVALYSKMWRNFDRGLYLFFKSYIFLPICEPTFSVLRKFLGLCVSYLFVLLWHGFTHQYIVWIAFNLTELLIEAVSKSVYAIPAVKGWRERNLSDTKFRRLLAWLQIFPLAIALYSTFYFLAGADAGWVFVDRIFWRETAALQWPFWLLIFYGYFFVNCCMDAERWIEERKKKQKLKAQ